VSAAWLALACAAGVASNAVEPTLQILEPLAGHTVTGAVRLRARLEPPAAAGSVMRFTFSANGRTVCRRGGPPLECRWDAGPVPAAHQISASVLLRDGKRLSAGLRTAGPLRLEPVAVDLVYVPATVTDVAGRGVPGLGVEAFSLLEDAAPQAVSHFLGPDAPRELVVAIDISASMAASMPEVRRAVKAFLAALRPEDEVTLLAFNDNVFTLAPRGASAAARQAAAARLAGWGGTSLYDVVLHSLRVLSEREGRKALVVFTDGDDQSSRATLEDVQRRAGQSAVPMYLIAQGRGTEAPKLQGVLERLARSSGGRAFVSGPDSLSASFAEILEDFEGQYLLGYVPERPGGDGSWRKIQVGAGVERRVRAREGYLALAREEREP
jgi:Ca-activated chloride channel family protein